MFDVMETMFNLSWAIRIVIKTKKKVMKQEDGTICDAGVSTRYIEVSNRETNVKRVLLTRF